MLDTRALVEYSRDRAIVVDPFEAQRIFRLACGDQRPTELVDNARELHLTNEIYARQKAKLCWSGVLVTINPEARIRPNLTENDIAEAIEFMMDRFGYED